jgi:inhibitor of cysteine peptidase
MASVTVRKDDNRRHVDIRPGDDLRVILPEIPSTGFRWQVTGVEPTILGEVGSSFKSESEAVGGGGMRTMSYQAVGVGKCQIRFLLTRPWEEARPRDEVDLVVVVHPK